MARQLRRINDNAALKKGRHDRRFLVDRSGKYFFSFLSIMPDKDYRDLALSLDNGGPLLRRHAEQTEINLEVLKRKWLR